MTHGSLFTGIGGFDLGFERAGFATAWQCENDRFCNQVLAARWPEVTRYGDITQLDPQKLAPVDVVSGGFPCQDLSVAGRRAGLAGERSGLFWELVRVLAGARPRWCVLENVPGLLTAGGGADFEAILDALDELGYFVEWATLDSRHFGVPQRRRRVFLVGRLGGPPRRPVLLEPEGLRGDPPPVRQAGEDVARCLTGRTGGASAKEHQETFVVSHAVGCHQAKGGDPTMDNYAVCYKQNQQDEVRATRPCIKRPSGKNSPFLLNEGLVRRLTPLECERLQGFPDGWTALEGAKDTPRYRALGNAVTVPVAAWIAQRLLEADV